MRRKKYYWIVCDYKKLEHGFIENYVNQGICCPVCRSAYRSDSLQDKSKCPNCETMMGGIKNEPR